MTKTKNIKSEGENAQEEMLNPQSFEKDLWMMGNGTSMQEAMFWP